MRGSQPLLMPGLWGPGGPRIAGEPGLVLGLGLGSGFEVGWIIVCWLTMLMRTLLVIAFRF